MNVTHRMMPVSIYRSRDDGGFIQKPTYWFMRVVNPITGSYIDTNITEGKAADLVTLGVPRIDDGGGL